MPRNFHLHQGLLGEYTQLSSNQWGQLRGVTYKSAELRYGTEPKILSLGLRVASHPGLTSFPSPSLL